MRKKLIAMIGSGILVTGLAVSGASFAESGDSEVRDGTIRIENKMEAEFPVLAKITLDQAVHEALADVPGRVLKTELEDENGFLVYGVEVVTDDKTIMDVKVDAGNGKVLSVEQDKADNDDRESGKYYKNEDEE